MYCLVIGGNYWSITGRSSDSRWKGREKEVEDEEEKGIKKKG